MDPITLLIAQFGLIGIAFSAFLSYSILPLPTEPILSLGITYFKPSAVLLVALLGATLGSVLNYYIGLKGIRLLFFKRKSTKETRARKIFDRWGGISILLFSWVPIVGDPLLVVAGVLKMRFSRMLIYSILGKAWYFALIIWGSWYFFS